MKNQTVIHNSIKKYRKSRGWTQTQLAFICKTTKNNISCIENGLYNPSLELAFLLCYAFQVNFYDLFSLDFNEFIDLHDRREILNESLNFQE